MPKIPKAFASYETALWCYCICLVRQIGASENNRTKTVFGAVNKDYEGGATC